MDDPLLAFPGYVLRRAASAAGAALAARLKAIDLRQTDASVLFLINANVGISSAKLGEALGIQSANMVTLMGRLEAAGLIERLQIDGRTQGAHLTDQGRQVMGQARKIIEAFEQELMQRIPEVHRPHLLPALLAIWNE